MFSPVSRIISFVLVVSIGGTSGFLLSQIKTGGPTTRARDFIHVGPKDHSTTSKPDFSVYVLPGTLVLPSSYEAVCHQIGSLCRAKNVTADVSIAKFTLNAGHRFESKSLSEKIKRDARSDNIVIVGHSASAVVGAEIAECVDASGFVQWCGTFNSNGDFPWDVVDPNKYDLPIMSILAENDAMMSFPVAAREFCGFGNHTSNKIIPTSIKDAGHFSGIYMDDREFEDLPRRLQDTIERTGTSVDDLFDMSVVSVAWRVSEFIGYLNGSPKSSERIRMMQESFRSKFGELSDTQSRDNPRSMMYGNNLDVYHVHTQHPPGLLYALVYAAFPEIRSIMTLLTVVIPFIFSYPSSSRSISISSIVNPLPGAMFSNPSIWAKIPYAGPEDFSRSINSDTFEKALSDVSDEDRKAYFVHGKPMVFARDTGIPKVPGCGLAWVATPLVVEKEESFVSVSSPVISLKDTLNTKLISRKQCLEWILVGCFK